MRSGGAPSLFGAFDANAFAAADSLLSPGPFCAPDVVVGGPFSSSSPFASHSHHGDGCSGGVPFLTMSADPFGGSGAAAAGDDDASSGRIRSAICRTAQRTWCCYVSSEWREFSVILDAETLPEAEAALEEVLDMVFVGIFQDRS